MQHGDIDNTPLPRLYLVLEDLVLLPPPSGATPPASRSVSRRLAAMRDRVLPPEFAPSSGQRARHWKVNEALFEPLWRVAQSGKVAVDAVTFLPDSDLVAELEHRFILRGDLPISTLRSRTEDAFASEVGWEQSIAAVADPRPDRALRWGAKGLPIEAAMPGGALNIFYR